MKILMTLALCCAAVILSAQSPWDGKAESVAISKNKITAQKLTVADGVITASGKTTGTDRYTYLTVLVKTAPFTLNGKKLSATAWGGDCKPGDTLYIKAKAAGNKCVLSAYKGNLPTLEPKQYTIIPEKNGDLNWIPHQINAPIDAPIIELEFTFGRKGNGNDLKLMVKDIKLVD